jgi:nucleoside-diphosphate-sugar epimerase
VTFWQSRKVLITGGASFIGSHVTDALVKRRGKVRVLVGVHNHRHPHMKGRVELEDQLRADR